MSHNNRNHLETGLQAIDVQVTIRRSSNSTGDVRAFADVLILLGVGGNIKLIGYSVYHPDGKSPQVLPPARKGNQRYFPYVETQGRIQQLINSAVIEEYELQPE